MLTRILPLFFFVPFAYFAVKKGLTTKFTKSTKVRFHAAFSISLLFVVFGCATNDIMQVDVPEIAIPEVIDIGQVRVKDSPVNTSFTIANRSTITVEIDEILSGCGCTVIDLPSKTIRPKVYGDHTFLRNVRKIRAVSKDDMITIVSHILPDSDSDPLEIVVTIGKDSSDYQELVRGSFTLFSHNDSEATVQVSGIVVSE